MSLTTDRIKKKNKMVYLIRGKEDGKPTWYYIELDKLKLPLLEKQQRKLGVDIALDTFGTVVECGWGEEPPEDVKKRMLEVY